MQRSKLTTDLESNYSHKGSTRGDVTISGVSVVRNKLQWLSVITETHLAMSVPFHLLKFGWSVHYFEGTCFRLQYSTLQLTEGLVSTVRHFKYQTCMR